MAIYLKVDKNIQFINLILKSHQERAEFASRYLLSRIYIFLTSDIFKNTPHIDVQGVKVNFVNIGGTRHYAHILPEAQEAFTTAADYNIRSVRQFSFDSTGVYIDP